MPKRRDGWVGADPLTGEGENQKGGYSRGADPDDPSAWPGTFEYDPTNIPGSIDDWTKQYGYSPSSSADAYRQFLGDAGGDWAAKEGECNARGAGWRWVPNADGTGSCHRPPNWNAPDEPEIPDDPLPQQLTSSDPQFPEQPGVGTLGELPIPEDVVPFVPPAWEEPLTIEVGTDPLSLMQNIGAEGLYQGGGLIRTPLTEQTQNTLSALQRDFGAVPTPQAEQDMSGLLGDVMARGGVPQQTALESDTEAMLRELVERGGALPEDQQRRAMELESARTPLDALRRAQLAQGQGALASRGLLGQGPELDYMERVESRLAPMYAQAGQQIALQEKQAADQRYREALTGLAQQASYQRQSADQQMQTAQQLQTNIALDQSRRQDARLQQAIQESSGLTLEQSRNMVDTINSINGIQEMRTNAALSVLDRNMEWNKFLAEFGLERDQVIETIDSGRFAEILPLLQAYMDAVQVSAGGYTVQG